MTGPEQSPADPADLLPAWNALVEKTLGGASFEKKLVTSTYDGVQISPLYGPHTPGGVPEEGSGYPGQFPHIRGRTSESTALSGWDIRQLATPGDLTETNALILEDLQGGVSSVQLELWDGRKPRIHTLDELDQLLAGVHLNMAAISLKSGPHFMATASQLITLWDQRGVDRSEARGCLGADPLGTIARGGYVPADCTTMYAAMRKLATLSAKELPQVRSVSIDLGPYHEAGASNAQCLGIAMATGVAYLRELTEGGLSAEEAAREISFHLPLDTHFFSAMATIRSLRNVWSRVLNQCGVTNPDTAAWIHVLPSRRVLTQRDPWVNQLRNTACCFAGAVAGADAITTLPHDGEYAAPSSFSARVARNTHNVLQAESHLSRVIDAAGGAYFIETMTEALSSRGWSYFTEIESKGGMEAAYRDGVIASDIETVVSSRDDQIAKRKQPITGVSEFANLNEDHLQLAELDEPEPTEAPAELLLSRESPLDQILSESSAHRVTTLTHTTIGPLSYQSGLPLRRDARHFEALRDRSDAYAELQGQRPTIWLACLGTVAEHTARATFVRNLLAAGGIDTILSGASKSAQDLAEAFADSPCSMAVICGTDAAYLEHAEALSHALRKSDALWIGLAGRSNETLKELAIDGFMHLGCNVLSLLETLWASLEQPA